jgi:hypothetical protein
MECTPSFTSVLSALQCIFTQPSYAIAPRPRLNAVAIDRPSLDWLESISMKTQGEIEAAICEGISRFEQDYMGRVEPA